jgi:hypothetical protein
MTDEPQAEPPAQPLDDADAWEGRWDDEPDDRWPDLDPFGAQGAEASEETEETEDPCAEIERRIARRPRVTHLVLVDGLPADHWVEDAPDGRWDSGSAHRRARLRLAEHDQPPAERELRWLDELVGGRKALLALGGDALPATPFDPDGLSAEEARRAVAISAQCDRHSETVFADPEVGTALRRTLEAVLRADPGFLQRSDRDDTALGAVIWVGAQANGLLGPSGMLLAQELWARIAVPSSSSSRGSTVLRRLRGSRPAQRSGEAQPPYGAPQLKATGRPELLTSTTRSLIIARRDAALAERASSVP